MQKRRERIEKWRSQRKNKEIDDKEKATTSKDESENLMDEQSGKHEWTLDNEEDDDDASQSSQNDDK